MERKDYQEPTMKVVQLRHRPQLLVGSEKTQTNGGSMPQGVEAEDF